MSMLTPNFANLYQDAMTGVEDVKSFASPAKKFYNICMEHPKSALN